MHTLQTVQTLCSKLYNTTDETNLFCISSITIILLKNRQLCLLLYIRRYTTCLYGLLNFIFFFRLRWSHTIHRTLKLYYIAIYTICSNMFSL